MNEYREKSTFMKAEQPFNKQLQREEKIVQNTVSYSSTIFIKIPAKLRIFYI